MAGGKEEQSGVSGRVTMSYWLSFMPELILTVGIAFGWYIRWQLFGFTVLLGLGMAGLGIFAGHLILQYLFRSSCLGSIVYLWFGCLLTIISLYDVSPDLNHHYNKLEDVMNLLLMASLICKFLVDLFAKCFRTPSARNWSLWPKAELFQVLGASAACLMAGVHTGPLLVLLFSFFLVLTAIKLGSIVSCANLIFLLMATEHYLFPDMNMAVNPYGIICFVGRLCSVPLLDLVLYSQSRLERWQGFMMSRKIVQRLCFLVSVASEMAFFLLHATVVKNHKEWYVVVPFFALMSVLWFLMHFVFLMIFGTLINRFSRCRDHLGAVTGLLSLKKVLAARGLRYFSLIAQKLVYLCVGSSILLGILCWTTRNSYNHSLLAVVVAIETMIAELLHEFSSSLGGTCIGYGIIAPVTAVRTDGMVTVLPPNFIQEAGSRSTQTLQALVDFFTQHMITNYGCDWSMGGTSSEDLEKKIQDFFDQTTLEGPRYDSYLLYYSGPSNGNGDWALTGGSSISLDRILTLWDERNVSKTSRLLLVCDCEHSHQWIKPVWRLKQRNQFVGLQTAKFFSNRKSPDIPPGIGEYTRLWVDYNASGGNRAVFDNALGSFRPVYAVSSRWTDFHFHLPNSEEILSYWMRTLPRVTHPCMGLVVVILSAKIPSVCCDCILKVLRRIRLKLWPPAELDTGHGFKLIRL